MIRVAIIDDHSVVRMGLMYMIQHAKDMEMVGEAESGEGAAEFVRGVNADVVLLDMYMPGVDGLAALDAILKDNPSAKVIMLSTSNAEEPVYRAITAGAKGWLLKETKPHELLDAIRTVASGGTAIPPGIKSIIDVRDKSRSLTPRELEILSYVARGLTNIEIGEILNIGCTTVKAHLSKIFETMGAADRAEAVAIGIRRGLIHE